MYKQKDCSNFQNHYIYKNISLKLGITPKHWFTNIKVLWKDPKHVCIMYVCINILLPHYIKVTNLKTVLTDKQIKVKQSPLNGLNVMWHAAWAVYWWLFRNNHRRTTCGSWKLTGTAPPVPAAEGIPRTHWALCTAREHNSLRPMHRNGLCIPIITSETCVGTGSPWVLSNPLHWLGRHFISC